jgi:hypothetical protein
VGRRRALAEKLSVKDFEPMNGMAAGIDSVDERSDGDLVDKRVGELADGHGANIGGFGLKGSCFAAASQNMSSEALAQEDGPLTKAFQLCDGALKIGLGMYCPQHTKHARLLRHHSRHICCERADAR